MRLISRFALIALAALSITSPLLAQDSTKLAVVSPWKNDMMVRMNLSEVSFSHWTQGGTDALAYLAALEGKSERNDTNTNWATAYKFKFGQAKLNEEGIRKTDDEINLESVLTLKYGLHVNPYMAASLLTQFAAGYDYPDTGAKVQVSDFFDPAYIKQSAGVGFLISKELKTRLGLALREIITNKFNQYAAEPLESETKKIRVTGGFESETEIELPVDDNVLFKGKLDLFAPMKTLDRMVLHGETTLVAKVSKIFSAELSAFFINDPDVTPFTQIKQGLSIGIAYAIL